MRRDGVMVVRRPGGRKERKVEGWREVGRCHKEAVREIERRSEEPGR
jgi:hypothetical protein